MKTPPLPVTPFPKPFVGEVIVPGSKSITNRIFPLAVLSSFFSGKDISFSGALKSEDSEIMKNALEKMGVKIIEISENTNAINTAWTVSAGSFFSDKNDYEIFCGNSGTTIRFLTALCALRKGETTLTGVERMKKRPIGDLVSGIEQLGARVQFLQNDGFPPIKITPISQEKNKNEAKKISLAGNLSSQFFTALFHIAPVFSGGVEVVVEGELVSKPYIDMTLHILSDFGVEVENVHNTYQKFIFASHKKNETDIDDSYSPQFDNDFLIEGDASGASYPLAIAAITGGKCVIKNLPENLEDSIQGDAKFSELVLDKMCISTPLDNRTPSGVEGGVKIKPLGEINLEDIPDVAMTAAVLCAYADGYSKITGLSTLRHKECDRLYALESNLKKMGIKVKTGNDYIEIWGDPQNIHGAEIECFGDHRVAMCFAVLGTVVAGVKILDPDCVQKTYPSFWKDLEKWRSDN
jgi:3-phosphoshikimate 1-carboxyvinyltransferase